MLSIYSLQMMKVILKKENGIRINLPNIAGYYKTMLNILGEENVTLSVLYDLSSLPENTRYTDDGYETLIRQDCYIPSSCSTYNTNKFTSFSMFQKFGVIGDSYASGQIFEHNGDNVTKYELSWGQILARKSGSSCINFSKGGLTTSTWLTDSVGLQKLQSEESLQLYILALGINDVTKGTELGTIADIKEDYTQNPNTFYGNYAKIIELIKIKSPNCKLIMSTMANNTENYSSFNNAILEIANHYNIPTIKQYDNDFFNSSFYKNNMIYGHPTAPIYSGMSNAIEDLICECMIDNINYFENYIG